MLLIDALTPSGGGERLAMQIAMRLDPERFERTLCVSRWDPADASDPLVAAAVEDLRASGVELLLLERSSAADLPAWRPLWKRMRRREVDVLHAHKFGSNVWGTALGRAARVPVVVTHEHNWSYEGQPVRRLLDRELIARRSDAFIAVSRENVRRMIEIEGVNPADVLFVPNGIPAARMNGRPDARSVRDELAIGADEPVIGTVAVLRAEKALDVLVRATARLAPDFPGLKVLVAGSGPERERLERLAGELGVTGNMRWLGMRDDVPRVIEALDVAVCSSSWEGSPLSVMEYMQAGKPVVASRVGGIPDLVDDGRTGALVDSGDDEALAAAVARYLGDRELAAETGARGRELQLAEFDLDLMVRRLEGIYERLYEQKTGERPRPRRRRTPVASASHARPRLELLGDPAAARAHWQALAERCPNVFGTWEWADAWWRAYGAGRTPLVTLARRANGDPLALLPLYVWRARPARVVRLIGHGPGDELGPVCAPEDRHEAAAAMSAALARAGRWDLFLAERLRADEDWRAPLGAERIEREESPVLRFDGDFDAFLKSRSKNFREQVRRRERKLAREHDLQFRLADDPERLQDDLTTLFRLHAERWSEEGANAFAGVREGLHRDFAARALERGWLRLWMLEVDGRPVAAWYGFRYAGAECYYQAGRDPAWDSHSVGFILMAHSIRAALDDGIREYRFLIGGEEYKGRFASEVEYVDTLARAATLRGRGAVLAAQGAHALPTAIRRPLGRLARG